jgi:hypothetical protein
VGRRLRFREAVPSGVLVAFTWAGAALLPCPAAAADFQVNSYTAGDQGAPWAAATSDGRFVVSWMSSGSYGDDAPPGTSIQVRRFDSAGVPEGLELQANTYTPGFQQEASLALAQGGGAVIVWFNEGPAESLRMVQGRRFAPDGTPAGDEFTVGPAGGLPGGQAALPMVAMDAAGGFVAVWQAEGGDGLEIEGRRYGADGTPLGPQFQANTNTSLIQAGPRVQVAPDGRTTIAWQSETAPGDAWHSIQARQFAADGTPLGPEFQVNALTSGSQIAPRLGMDPLSGDFVVAWESAWPTVEYQVKARRYKADGTPRGDELLVSDGEPGSQGPLALAVAPGGEFLVAWRQTPSPPASCPCPILARRFHADGTPVAPAFPVSSLVTGGMTTPSSVAVDGDGNFLVFWESYGSAGSDSEGSSVQGAREVSDLTLTNDDGVATAVPGGTLTYTVTARHETGLQSVVNATVSDPFPTSLACTWSCAGSGGGVCTPGPVSGPIADPVVLPVGGGVTYTAECAIAPTATGSITTTATLTGAPGLFDPIPGNNSAADVDLLHGLVVDDVVRAEGNSGVTTFHFTVTLASPAGTLVTVDYGTADGTATLSNGDYLPASGTFTFAPGQTKKSLTVMARGDTAFEADETFAVALTNAVGSLIARGEGVGTILNDDSAPPSGSRDELVHGSTETASLETQPGPTGPRPIAREWRLRQAPNASYEVVVDAVTGDLGPEGPALDLLASNGVAVQSAVAASGGASRSLRFENHGPAVTNQRIRVQSRGCILDCDAADTFRIRLLETTLHGARFNNAATQVTVVAVQNTSDEAVSGHLDFWSGAGALLHSEPLALGPRQSRVLNTFTIPALQGQSGSLTLTHDGHYGTLQGKAVGVEPSTGFAFDAPLEPR